ncbi:hypothetical protein ABZ897_53155 [Nonomuraea sp. NPDC046802]|uniref:hypothetical protein n=1 Tax=Nonomuraea sp. NPDC046802 TaxID=3154919 RepID=UPI0033DF4708
MTKQYAITIAPVVNGQEAKPDMVVRVEIIDGQPHVVEFTMRAQVGADLASGPLPFVDLEYLARAFAPSESAQAVTPPPSAPEPPDAEPARRPAARKRAASPAPAAGGGLTTARAYRKMPDPAELQRVYSETSSIAGVAKHYDVPTHTAQGWISRLRRRGLAEKT